MGRDIDDLVAAEWALEELGSLEASGAGLSSLPAEPEAPAAPDPWLEEALRREEEAAERDRLVAEAYARGFEAGREAGEAAEGIRLRSAVHATEQALDELREGEMRWTGAIEENVCALAVAVARLLVGRELREDAEGVVELVRRALAEFPIDQPVRIRVHPQDLTAIEAFGSGDNPLLGVTRGREARWIPDPRLAPGGFMVEGRDRIVDGRVDAALERIYRRLTYLHA